MLKNYINYNLNPFNCYHINGNGCKDFSNIWFIRFVVIAKCLLLLIQMDVKTVISAIILILVIEDKTRLNLVLANAAYDVTFNAYNHLNHTNCSHEYETDPLNRKNMLVVIDIPLHKPTNALLNAAIELSKKSNGIKSHTNHTRRITDIQEGHQIANNLFKRSISLNDSTISSDSNNKCESKILDRKPDEPYYDFSDIVTNAVQQLQQFLQNKFPMGIPSDFISKHHDGEIARRSSDIANNVLEEDDNLLVFALAVLDIGALTIKFKDNITIPKDKLYNQKYLGYFWQTTIGFGSSINSNINSDDKQEWGLPFRDCNIMLGRWLWPFQVTSSVTKFRIVGVAYVAADEDVCNDGLEEIFGRKHGCDRNTTFCLLTENKPLSTRDVYTCICKESYYLPNSTVQGFRGDLVELSEGYDNYSCLPCPGGCANCDADGLCLYEEIQETEFLEVLLKALVGSVLVVCFIICIVLSFVVFRQRKCKPIAYGLWMVLEAIIFGIMLLYASVAIHFFPASTKRCLLEPWLRELGFIICYGAIILKLYRHLLDFRTRKAHRWILRDVDLLKYLGTMVFATVCYLSVLTISSLDMLDLSNIEGLREVRTNTCIPLKCEAVNQISEILILCFGLHLAIASRNADTLFKERQFLVLTILIEFMVSSFYYLFKYIYLTDMSPSTILLALFVRSQLTNTVILGLTFIPKLWYHHKQVSLLAYDISVSLPVDAFKVSRNPRQQCNDGYGNICLGDLDIGEITISEMSPEDIRSELKRLYTQLEILKSKSLCQNNPHISKRRGGRKVGHRRFSLQKKTSKEKACSVIYRSNNKHHHHHHHDIETAEVEASRSPEESICSNERPLDVCAEMSNIPKSPLNN